MVDGPVSPIVDEAFWDNRAHFFESEYGIKTEEYHRRSQEEITRISKIQRDASVYLWFEHDLFCQCNLWFTAMLLQQRKHSGKTFLVTPVVDEGEILWQGFGNHGPEGHKKNFQHRTLLAPLEVKFLAQLWKEFANLAHDKIHLIAKDLANVLPYLPEIVQLIPDSVLLEDGLCPVQKTLLKIQDKEQSTAFEKIFMAFMKAHGHYGFGDLQVARMLKSIPIATRALIRPAVPEECGILSELAHTSKAHWGYPSEWISLWKEDLTVLPEKLEEWTVLVIEVSGKPVGFGAIDQQNDIAEIEHLWILPKMMGLGLGKKLLDALIVDFDGVSITVTSDPNAAPFYEKMGFVFSHEEEGMPKGRTLPVLLRSKTVHKSRDSKT